MLQLGLTGMDSGLT